MVQVGYITRFGLSGPQCVHPVETCTLWCNLYTCTCTCIEDMRTFTDNFSMKFFLQYKGSWTRWNFYSVKLFMYNYGNHTQNCPMVNTYYICTSICLPSIFSRSFPVNYVRHLRLIPLINIKQSQKIFSIRTPQKHRNCLVKAMVYNCVLDHNCNKYYRIVHLFII